MDILYFIFIFISVSPTIVEVFNPEDIVISTCLTANTLECKIWCISLILFWRYFRWPHCHSDINKLNPLSANPRKWSNTLKQFVGNLPTNCLSVFDHFVILVLKGLNFFSLILIYKRYLKKIYKVSPLSSMKYKISIREKTMCSKESCFWEPNQQE